MSTCIVVMYCAEKHLSMAVNEHQGTNVFMLLCQAETGSFPEAHNMFLM